MRTAASAAAAGVAAGRGGRRRGGPTGFDEAISSRHHPTDGFPRFGVMGQRSVLHALFDLEPFDAFTFASGNGFVDVSGHGVTTEIYDKAGGGATGTFFLPLQGAT